MEHSEGQNRQWPTTNQLVQVIQTLQQEVQALQSQQAEREAAAATSATLSLVEGAPGHRDYKAGMKPPRPTSFNDKNKGLQNFLSQLDVFVLLAGQH